MVALFLSSLMLAPGCDLRTADGETVPRMDDRRLVGTTTGEREPEGSALSAPMPAEDARDEPVPGLPRHPGSVRTGYSESREDGLVVVRAAYLSQGNPDAVSGFYRESFRSGGWEVANVEYMDGWHFLVVRGNREAEVAVGRKGSGSEVEIEVTRPVGVQEDGASAGGSKR
jgi:hypothetical protein